METAEASTPGVSGEIAPDWPQILERLAARHSCRDFDGSGIDPEILAAIVRDGLEAPSSCNQQNWHFIVVTDREKMRRAHEISGGNHHFSECSALIYLCFQKGWTHGNFSIVQSVAGATYHMMLSAHLRGFQCIWNAGIGDKDPLRVMLGLPPIFELVGTLAIGRAKSGAPEMKAPRRPVGEVYSWEHFERPEHCRYPVKPAAEYPFFRIQNHDNPFAEWNPAKWSWAQVGDFRGYSVWAKSPLKGVYVSRRQGDATGVELGLLPELAAGEKLVEVMPWGGTYSAEICRMVTPGVSLHLAELSLNNLSFIMERLRREGAAMENIHADLMTGGTLPYADASVDAVVLTQALEHCPEPERMLDEVRRVLRPGGTLLVSARNMWSRFGWRWWRVEARGQIPNQGPYRPIPALRLRGWLRQRFRIDEELGIGRAAVADAEVMHGPKRFFGRLYAARCIAR